MKFENYLPHRVDIVTSTLDGSTIADGSSIPTLTWKYAGCLGSGRAILSLDSIVTTSDMVGLSTAFSCTHNNAILKHLLICSVWHSAPNEVSTNSSHNLSFHNCHDCNRMIKIHEGFF